MTDSKDVIVDHNIIVGNGENLKDFKNHFHNHDRQTLDGYYNIAKKKSSMLIVRRLMSNSPQMQVLVVPYKLAESKGGVREAIKSRFFPHMGWVMAIPIDSKRLYVFGELIPKNDGDGFLKPVPIRVKRKPFQSRSQGNIQKGGINENGPLGKVPDALQQGVVPQIE